MKVRFLIAAVLPMSAPAAAADRSLSTVWLVEAGSPSTEVRELRRGDFVFKQRLLPLGLAETDKGEQLVEVRSAGALVFCSPAIRAQKLLGHAQPCFVDADSDGHFEAMFTTTSVTKGMLTVQGNRPKTPKPIEPLAYRRVAVTEFRDRLFMGVQYRGNANPMGNHVFEVNFGSEGQMGSLTNRFVQKKVDVPGARDFMGGRFSILEAAGESIRVRIDQPMPEQPFGVLKTTTYRSY